MEEGRKADRFKTEGDSVLLLRQMYVTWLASNSGKLRGAFLEHPADPAQISCIPYCWECSSIWPSRCMKCWCRDIGATTRTFDQCRLGHRACPKSTTIADKLGMTTLDNKFCECRGRLMIRGGISAEELGRYGNDLLILLADKIADPTPEATDTTGTQFDTIERVRLGFKMRIRGRRKERLWRPTSGQTN
jgi:hypothetical protein